MNFNLNYYILLEQSNCAYVGQIKILDRINKETSHESSPAPWFFKIKINIIFRFTFRSSRSSSFDRSHPVVLYNDKVIYSVKTQNILIINTIKLATCFGSLNHPQANSNVLCFRNWPEDVSVNRNMSPGL